MRKKAMQYEELSQRYQAAAEKLLPVLSEVGEQTLKSKIIIESDDPSPLTGEFAPDHEYPLLKVTLESTADGTYEHVFLMDKSLAGMIFSWMEGSEAPEEVGAEHLDAVKEMVAQVLGQLQAAFEGEEFTFSVGDVQLNEIASQEDLALPEEALVAAYRFTHGKKRIKNLITHVVQGELAAEEVEGTTAEEAPVEEAPAEEAAAEEAPTEEAPAEEAPAEEVAAEEAPEETPEPVEGLVTEDISPDLPLEGAGELAGTEDMAALFGGEEEEGGVVEVSPAELEEFPVTELGDGKVRKIDLLLDVELDVSVELGRKVMYVEEILRLGKGSIVELNKLAGEPVGVLVNGKKLAEGEVVVVEDHFGVRLTHLVEPKERIKSLGKEWPAPTPAD